MSPISEGDKAAPRKLRSLTPSSGRIRTAKRSSTPGVRAEHVKRPGSAPRGRPPAARLPPPVAPLVLQDHIIADDEEDINVRVARLEKQRVDDHRYLAQIAASISGLEQHFGAAHQRLTDVEEAQRGPLRDFQARQDMRDFRAQVEQDIVKGMELTAAGIAPKLHEIQNVMLECQVALANLQDKELKIENYLNKLDGERPQEGQQVVSGFESMQLEIGSVRDMVKRLESSTQATPHPVVPSSVIFTEQMRAGLVELHEKVTVHDKNIYEINVNVANVGVYQGEVHGRVRALEDELAKANRRRTAAATFNQGTVNALNLKESFSGGGGGCGSGGGGGCGCRSDDLRPR